MRLGISKELFFNLLGIETELTSLYRKCWNLVECCCKVVADLYSFEELEKYLPPELLDICQSYILT